jgi:DNA-binding GntR family transcriptional regulator
MTAPPTSRSPQRAPAAKPRPAVKAAAKTATKTAALKAAEPVVVALPRHEDASLAADIAKRLEEEILRGRVRPGTRLDERELSARYQVSRTPVREALQRLSASGLAVARGRQGLQVAQMSVADLLDALSVVAELEALACMQAARRITAEQRKGLQVAFEACGKAAAKGDADGFYDANIDFHNAIAEASHNRVLQDELRRLSLKTAPYRRTITFQPGRMAASQPEHEAVLKAILGNDPVAAGTLMRSHLSMLSDGISDFLHFIRRSEHSGLFLENP